MQNNTIPAAAAEQKSPALPHNLIIENRHLATATGVTRIVSYDDTAASLETQQGTLTIGGRGIQVSELSLQTGELKIYGQIDYVQYSDPQERPDRFLRRFWH